MCVMVASVFQNPSILTSLVKLQHSVQRASEMRPKARHLDTKKFHKNYNHSTNLDLKQDSDSVYNFCDEYKSPMISVILESLNLY